MRDDVPRKYALFFHRLSILERATDQECINNCNHPKEMWVGLKCNGLIIFSQKGGTSKHNTACQIQGGSCGLATRSEISKVWKSAGGVELAAPPGSDWCGDRRGGREERRRHSAATREQRVGETERRKHEWTSFRVLAEWGFSMPILPSLQSTAWGMAVCEAGPHGYRA